MIPQETVNKILDSAEIVDVVGDFVSLKRRGANYIACCPFHNEKTPSFYVSPSKGIYKCFGCGKVGTAVGFVMEHENLSYVDALKFLAKKYSIEITEKELSPEELASKQRTESLYIVSDFAEKFFQKALQTDEGHSLGYQYFRSRGLEDSTIEKYGLGWSMRSRHALYDSAREHGFKEEFLTATGLCIKNDDGSIVDRFYDRAMFPIHSIGGRVIAFGGRTLKSGHPAMKYVNSPETEIYVKSNSLYGIYFAKNEISKRDKCFLVEGYLDVLSMHQLGITNVVASSGTSLTIPQIRMIKKFTDNVTIMYDGDSAGIHAALRGIGLVLKEGLNVKIILLPSGDDPDSYARSHSLSEVEDFIKTNEQDFIGFKCELLMSEAGGDPLKRAELINDIADTIALMPDAVKRSVYVQDCSSKFDILPDILFTRIATTREKLLADDRKARDRETRPINAPITVDEQDNNKILADAKRCFEQPLLRASELDILWFIYNCGLSPMEFETDSPFYTPEGECLTADFIRDSLQADNLEFQNSIYKKAYDAYYTLYDSDDMLSQHDIVKKISDGLDRPLADLVVDLTSEKHLLTVKNFEKALTAPSSKIVMFVPRAILVYQGKRIELTIRGLNTELKTAGIERQFEILQQIQKLTKSRITIDEKLGRLE